MRVLFAIKCQQKLAKKNNGNLCFFLNSYIILSHQFAMLIMQGKFVRKICLTAFAFRNKITKLVQGQYMTIALE